MVSNYATGCGINWVFNMGYPKIKDVKTLKDHNFFKEVVVDPGG